MFLSISLSKFPPSLYAPVISEIHRDEISRVFLVALDPLINQLLPFSPFMEQVLSDDLGGFKIQLPLFQYYATISEGSGLIFCLSGPHSVLVCLPLFLLYVLWCRQLHACSDEFV